METCFLSVAFLFTFSITSGERTLKFVTVLYRHGDRSPVNAYPTDPYKESDWPQGFGQLSQEGMRQHFELGQFLKKRYKGFLSEDYDRHEIFIRSTDVDRALMSAEVNLAGMFPPNGSEMFNPDLKWQPIPVHTVPENEDKLLSFPLHDCPRYTQLMNETEETDIFHDMTETYKAFIEMVKKKTGLQDINIGTVWSVYDTLFCEAKHGMQPPNWVTSSVMEKLKVLNDFGVQILFGVYKREEKCRLQGGLLLDQIIKNLSNAAEQDSKQKVKMIAYSAHDTTVVALQEALNVFNGLQPPYASCHLFELYQEENGMFSVEMFYRNNTVSEPYPVSLLGCSQRCPLQDFVNLTREVIPQDRNKECQIKEEAERDTGICHFTCHRFMRMALDMSPLRAHDSGSCYSTCHRYVRMALDTPPLHAHGNRSCYATCHRYVPMARDMSPLRADGSGSCHSRCHRYVRMAMVAATSHVTSG